MLFVFFYRKINKNIWYNLVFFVHDKLIYKKLFGLKQAKYAIFIIKNDSVFLFSFNYKNDLP